MVNLNIEKIKESSGGTKFKLSPASFTLGAQDANTVDQMDLTFPDDWTDKTVRVYFMPSGANPFYILWDGKPFNVTANMTKRAGAIVVDAIGGDYHAYSTTANYRTYSHLTPQGDIEPVYTPSQIEQFLATAQRYMTLAQKADEDAILAKDGAVKARSEAYTSANLAEEYRIQTQNLKDMAQSARDSAHTAQQRAEGYAQGLDTALNGAISAKNQAQSISDGMKDRLDSAIAQLVPPEVIVNRQTTTEYILQIKDKNGTYLTPNLKGADGQGAGDMLMSLYDSDMDGKVNSAQIADSATYAISATSAESSVHANTADSANHADTADSADYASIAESSRHAVNADHSDSADHATNSDTATNSLSADSAEMANKDSNGNIITDTYATVESVQILQTQVDNTMPKTGGTFTDVVTVGVQDNKMAMIVKNFTTNKAIFIDSKTNGDRGIHLSANGSWTKSIIGVDTNDNVSYAGGKFIGNVTAYETARTTRSIFNEETRASSTTGTLQSVKYFINVT